MKFVAIFPGQGSQAPGMGKFLFDQFPLAKEIYEEASDAISVDLKKLCFFGSEADLQLTENTQPALLATSVATYKVIEKEFSVDIAAAAGHSIGEYAALVASGVIKLSDATKAVRKRGQAMQSAVPVGQGGMVATLGLDDIQVKFLCQWAQKESGFTPLSPANFNAPGQIVISGSMDCLNWLKVNFKAEVLPGSPKRAKLIPLNVSAPFHCSMMAPAENVMSTVLKEIEFKEAKFPIVQNFVADFIISPETLRENLIKQVSAPVLWTQSLHKIKENNLFQFIEFGHGQVLKGLLKKIDPEQFQVWTTSSLDEIKALETHLKATGH